MRVTWSDQAIEAVRERFGSEPVVMKLFFDMDGCGCAVDGVTALWVIDEPEAGDVRAEGGSDGIEMWYYQPHEIFWDKELRITYNPERRTFKLSSDGQTYSNRLSVSDRRNLLSVK